MRELTADEEHEVVERLTEIAEMRGPFKRDPMEHATSVIEYSAENAKRIMELLFGRRALDSE